MDAHLSETRGCRTLFSGPHGGTVDTILGEDLQGTKQSLSWASEGSPEKPSVRCQRPVLPLCPTLS